MLSCCLQDSLSSYFTPSNSRRSRVAQSSFSLENFSVDEAKLKPLEIEVDSTSTGANSKRRRSSPTTTNGSKGSLEAENRSCGSPSSPARRSDKLMDSLSPYFAANAERRRKHEKGEYLQLCNGTPLKKRGEF